MCGHSDDQHITVNGLLLAKMESGGHENGGFHPRLVGRWYIYGSLLRNQ